MSYSWLTITTKIRHKYAAFIDHHKYPRGFIHGHLWSWGIYGHGHLCLALNRCTLAGMPRRDLPHTQAPRVARRASLAPVATPFCRDPRGSARGMCDVSVQVMLVALSAPSPQEQPRHGHAASPCDGAALYSGGLVSVSVLQVCRK